MRKRTRLILALLLPIQFLLLHVLKMFPDFIERYYSQGFYPYLSTASRYLFGWIPFSIGDVFYLLIGVLAIRWLYKNVRRLTFEPVRFFC